MNDVNYVYFSTYFDSSVLRQALYMLKEEGIDFKTVDKSNQQNYRVPMSTFIEVDILINEDEFERAERLLSELND